MAVGALVHVVFGHIVFRYFFGGLVLKLKIVQFFFIFQSFSVLLTISYYLCLPVAYK